MSALPDAVPADVVLGWVGAPAAAVSTATAAEPSPSPSPESFSPLEVSPGLAGFIPVFLIALACVVLFLSLTRHLRRVTVRQAQVDADEARRLDGTSGTEPSADDDGPARP